MGSSSKKKDKDKESRKRRHRDDYYEDEAPTREKRHKHKHKHHKEKKKSKHSSSGSKQDYQSDGSDVVEIIDSPPPQKPKSPSPPTLPPPVSRTSSTSSSRERPSVPSPEPQRQHTESLSIEETNRLRAKLGLKPLEIGSSSGSAAGGSSSKQGEHSDGKKKDDLGEFYHKPAENWREKSQQEKMREKLAEHREKRHMQSKLAKVRLLADSDSEEDNVENWVSKSRKIEKEKQEAEKRARMLEELDAQFGISEVIESEERAKRDKQYSEKNLRGMRVEHSVDSFKDERTTVLTLKDNDVLNDEDDVLINVNMVDDEHYKKNVENKKKKIRYNAYEDTEYDEFGNLKEKSVLAKYDEEIDGEKRDGFIIGNDNFMERKQSAAQSVKEKLARKKIESIAPTNLRLASEYYNEEEMAKFKKPKKKVRKIRSKGKLTGEQLEIVNNKGIEDVGSRRPSYKSDPDVFNIDDVPMVGDVPMEVKLEDDKDEVLEKALHKARKVKQKENLVTEFLSSVPIKMEPESENLDSGSIVLNSTAEFCRTLGDIPTYGKAGNREESEEIINFEKDLVVGEGEDEEMHSYNDEESEPIEKSGWNSVDPNETRGGPVAPITHLQEVQILDEEPDVSQGVGAALRLAMSKGYLEKEQNNRPSNSRLAHLQAKHYSIEDKAYGEEGDRQGRRDRYSGPLVEFREKETFKPNVKLEYIDDEGHILNSKEAFRYLSHKFHGKGPGKNKIEKRIKKSLQEQLMKKMSSTDTPLGTLNMLQAKQKETQSPFIVLSGGKQSQSTVISKTGGRK